MLRPHLVLETIAMDSNRKRFGRRGNKAKGEGSRDFFWGGCHSTAPERVL